MVKSDYGTITVPEIELEIPPTSQKGEISTVEGVISRYVWYRTFSMFRIRVLFFRIRIRLFPESVSANKSGSMKKHPKAVSSSKSKFFYQTYFALSSLNTILFGQVPKKPNQRTAFRSLQFVKEH